MRSILPLAATLLTIAPGLAQAKVPDVVTDIPVVQSLVAQVMGDLGKPSVLLGQNSDPHHYQLRPSQAGALQDSDLVVWIGPRLTPWLERALDGIGAQDRSLSLLAQPGTHTRKFSGDDPHDHSADLDEDEDDDHADHDHADHDHADHDHAAHDDQTDPYEDPHAWFDPANASLWVGDIAQQLSKLDPEHAKIYAENAKAAQARIAAMDTRLKAEYAPVKDTPFLVYHAAYGYLADHYGLHVAGALSPSDATAPGAAHMVSLRKEIDTDTIACAFPEAQHDPKMVSILVDGTPVKLGGALDPAGSTLPYGADLYEALMQKTADTITTCLESQH